MELETQLAASFSRPGDDQRIREIFRADASSGNDRLSLGAAYGEGAIHFAYPCVTAVGRR